MKFWTRWRVATRLALTFTLIGITCLALLAGSFIQQRRANTAIESISVAEINKLTDTYELSAMALSVTPRVVAVNMTADPALHKALGPEIVPLLVQIDKKVEKISGWAQSSEEKAWLIKLAETGASIRQSLAEVEKIRKSGDAEGARDAFIRLVKPKATHYDELLVEFTKFQRAQFAANSMALQEAGWNAWNIHGARAGTCIATVDRSFRAIHHVSRRLLAVAHHHTRPLVVLVVGHLPLIGKLVDGLLIFGIALNILGNSYSTDDQADDCQHDGQFDQSETLLDLTAQPTKRVHLFH